MAKQKPLHFRISGYFGNQPVIATWSDGQLEASPALIEAARKLIDSGYVFGTASRQVPADLDSPFAALLTMIRCFERIIHAAIELPLDTEWGSVSDGSGSSWVFWAGNGHSPGMKGSAGDLDLGF